MHSTVPTACCGPNCLPSQTTLILIAFSNSLIKSKCISNRNMGLIFSLIVASDGREHRFTGPWGAFLRVLQPGRGGRTTSIMLPGALALRSRLFVSLWPRLCLAPMPSSRSVCIVSTSSSLVYSVPPRPSLTWREPAFWVFTKLAATLLPWLPLATLTSPCSGCANSTWCSG